VIAPGIPVCSVTTRYNLFVGGICGKKQSYFWGAVAPWIVGFVFCQGEIFANMLNWTSLIFNGLVNFLVPFILYASSLKMVQAGGAPPLDPTAQPFYHDPSSQGCNHPHVEEEEFDAPVVGERGALQAGTGSSNKSSRAQEAARREAEHKEALITAYSAPVSPPSNLNQPLLIAGADSQLTNSDSNSGVPESPSLNASVNGRPLSKATLEKSDTGSHIAVHFREAEQPTEEYKHGPVYPWPAFCYPYAYKLTIAVIVITEAIIIAQTIGDIVFAAQGGNALG
jgi:hypothetical protein